MVAHCFIFRTIRFISLRRNHLSDRAVQKFAVVRPNVNVMRLRNASSKSYKTLPKTPGMIKIVIKVAPGRELAVTQHTNTELLLEHERRKGIDIGVT